MFDRMFKAVRRHRDVSRTCRELERLNDRELKDIGISRSEIRMIAHRAS